MLGSLPGKTRATNHCFVYEMYTVNLNEFIALKLSETGFSCGMLDFRAVGSKSRTIFLDVTKFAFNSCIVVSIKFLWCMPPKDLCIIAWAISFFSPLKDCGQPDIGAAGCCGWQPTGCASELSRYLALNILPQFRIQFRKCSGNNCTNFLCFTKMV